MSKSIESLQWIMQAMQDNNTVPKRLSRPSTFQLFVWFVQEKLHSLCFSIAYRCLTFNLIKLLETFQRKVYFGRSVYRQI